MLEYLEEKFPEVALLPKGFANRAWVRSIATSIACDVHPLNNLRVLKYLEQTLGVTEQQKLEWIRHWITIAFDGLEARLASDGLSGSCCFKETPTFADCCLVPQVFSARRFGVVLEPYPHIVKIDAHLNALEPFRAAAPANQPDAE